MDVNEALSKLGKFRKWQMIQFTSLGIAIMFPGCFHMVAIVFIGYKPPHHCKILENSALNKTIPYENGQLSSCKMFVNYSQGNETMDCVNGWEYLGNDDSTIVTKWDLVCDRDGLAEVSQTMLVSGVMTGALVFTILSDRYGRKPIFMFCQMATVAMGLAAVTTNNIYIFFFVRFLTGALQQGFVLSGFILICELFGPEHRTFSGIMVEMFWAVCCSIYPFIARSFSNWVHLQIFVSLSGLLTIPLFKYMPESTIWLCANDRSWEAEKIIKNAAKMNGIKLPEKLLHNSSPPPPYCKNRFKNFAKKFFSNKSETNEVQPSSRYTILDLFRSRRLALYVCVCSLIWIVTTLVYYGLTLSTALMQGDRFWNAFFGGVVELPAYLTSYFCLEKFGRKKSFIFYFFIAGLSLLVTTLIPEPTGTNLFYLIILLNTLGKFGITGAFGIMFLIVSELFPTNLRNQALGISSFIGRTGNFLATFTTYVMQRYPRIPGLLFGFLSIGAALLVLLLPETRNRPLPETVEDIEAWFSKRIEPTKDYLIENEMEEKRPVMDAADTRIYQPKDP